jgi:hypothetical protein
LSYSDLARQQCYGCNANGFDNGLHWNE